MQLSAARQSDGADIRGVSASVVYVHLNDYGSSSLGVVETVFYSWQSDRQRFRDRLRTAIDSACVDLAMIRDEATRGVSGSPDITESIERKIETAAVIVADVSIVSTVGARSYPNPNVGYEVGYAAGLHRGQDRLVLVFDMESGSIGDLPFDLRNRRILQVQPNRPAVELAGALRVSIAAARRSDELLLYAEVARLVGDEAVSVLRTTERIHLHLSTASLSRLQDVVQRSADLQRRVLWVRGTADGVREFREAADWHVGGLTLAVCPIPITEYNAMPPEQAAAERARWPRQT